MTLSLLVFLFVVSVLVLVHELGHFLAAKRFGIGVEEFGIGLPPKVLGIKKGETVYSINLLPIGGFVKLFGEEGLEEARSSWRMAGGKEKLRATRHVPPAKLERAFFARPIWQRAIVLLSGVGMNFFLAVLVFSFLFTQGVLVPTDRVRIEEVVKDTPAFKAGLKKGDIILALDGEKIKNPGQLINLTKKKLGQKVTLRIEGERKEKKPSTPKEGWQKKTFEVSLVPRKDYPKGQGPMGIAISNFEERVYPWYKAPFWGTYEAFHLSWALIKGIGGTLWKLITFQSVKEEVAGPVGIAQLTGKAVRFGKMAVLELLGLLSLNLAVVNALPFPALDGGRLLFVGIEAATGRKIRSRWEKITHQVGMAILLALILLVTVNDILRLLR